MEEYGWIRLQVSRDADLGAANTLNRLALPSRHGNLILATGPALVHAGRAALRGALFRPALFQQTILRERVGFLSPLHSPFGVGGGAWDLPHDVNPREGPWIGLSSFLPLGSG